MCPLHCLTNWEGFTSLPSSLRNTGGKINPTRARSGFPKVGSQGQQFSKGELWGPRHSWDVLKHLPPPSLYSLEVHKARRVGGRFNLCFHIVPPAFLRSRALQNTFEETPVWNYHKSVNGDSFLKCPPPPPHINSSQEISLPIVNKTFLEPKSQYVNKLCKCKCASMCVVSTPVFADNDTANNEPLPSGS